MFYKKLENGKYRYFEKFFDKNQGKWRQTTITLNSKSRIAQSEARNRLSLKIEKILLKEEVQILQEVPTVDEVFKEWREIRDEELKASSVHTETWAFIKFLKKFGTQPISDVTGQEIQRFILDLNLAPTTRVIRKTYYNLLFEYAQKVGYIKSNPMLQVVLPKIRATSDDVRRKQNGFLDRKEMRLILNYGYSLSKYRRQTALFEFMFLTGLRIGELLALKWEDIDFQKKSLTVNHTLNLHGYVANARQLLSPKTAHSYRTISLNKRCMEILELFSNDSYDKEFIFVSEKGRIYGRDELSTYFKRICSKKLGSEGEERRYHLHMLRHSHISLLVEMNVPIKVIMERVGHSNEKMILQVYSHVTKNMRNDLNFKMNELSF
ncbi:site-specific integrase [Lactococcus garvieae subsp. garvieae]|uniref:tyrosine-type recombinase/integrase n=1 Tax=Lactococcus garvieae TaxID=1363 RepID=UPI0005AA1A13|nr:site-specific integrase [Lactococcus garvieae]KAA8710243.1 site-specific integrase [Lactococcus garvieae subsp. garvieae]MDG6191790.1 site-specific integrase [Lactococcus garvieae]QPR49297.1 site-specific integrase [Lactococcus garvieae]